MEKYIVAFFLFCSFFSEGQTFNGIGGKIPDFNEKRNVALFPILVEGLPKNIDCNFGLESVCLDIGHDRTSDLKISLIAPDSTEIWLSNRNGKIGGYYLNTCFKMNGFRGFIAEHESPFSGDYIPDGQLSFINNGQNPNGTWYLRIEDLAAKIDGNLSYFTLTFKDSLTCVTERCSESHPEFCVANNKKGVLLPDLAMLENVTNEQNNWKVLDNGDWMLQFSASMTNIGTGPLEISGDNQWYCGNEQVKGPKETCTNGEFPRQKIFQVIYTLQNGSLTKDSLVSGTLYYDSNPGHDHFHMDDWSYFSILVKNKKRNYKKWPVIGVTKKISYCLFDIHYCMEEKKNCQVDQIFYSEKNLQNYGFGQYSNCSLHSQGISVGAIDYYGFNYEGQNIIISKEYVGKELYLLGELDPLDYFQESNEKNNTFLIKLPSIN